MPGKTSTFIKEAMKRAFSNIKSRMSGMQPGCTNVVKKPEKMAYRKELAVIEILETKGFVKKKKKGLKI